MNDEVLISVSGVSKKFCRSLKRSLWYGVQDVVGEALPFLRGKGGSVSQDEHSLRRDEFWAVNDVSFELKRGECLGLIGRNGAGKTTLLKMLNNLIKPDTGTITMRGRVGALIALGAGFNPILTGRENVYVNGSILGMTKQEIDEQIDEIIDFAEIREFIDSPVQSYSSGMQVRLGFAVATALKPDILILDEVLAVGDMAFRNKCYNRIGKLRTHAAVIFVSHNMDHVANITDVSAVMQKGHCVFVGPPSDAIRLYNQENQASQEDGSDFHTVEPPFTAITFNQDTFHIHYGEMLHLELFYKSTESISDTNIRVAFYDQNDAFFAEWNSSFHNTLYDFPYAGNSVALEIGPILFKSGSYRASLLIQKQNSIHHNVWISKAIRVNIAGSTRGYAPYQLTGAIKG